ncbi:hypothetical protein [Candidatus Uabimicrobium sp. HlEnr_7]|uniref:hypothetical protein n=1 Tax=Candidatus Uabimicrobium helgolandensis TaxID=3095367 RepID=UPI003557A40C
MTKLNFELLHLLIILPLFCSNCAVSLSVGISEKLEIISNQEIGKKKTSIQLNTDLKNYFESDYSDKIIIRIREKHKVKIKKTYNIYKEHKKYIECFAESEFLGIPYIINNFIDLSVAVRTISDDNHYIQGGIFGAIFACIMPFVSLEGRPGEFLKKDYVGKKSEIDQKIIYTNISESILVNNESGKEISFKANNGYLTLSITELIKQGLLSNQSEVLTFSTLGKTSNLKVPLALINRNHDILENSKSRKSRDKKINDLYLFLQMNSYKHQILLRELIYLLEKKNTDSS